MVSWIGKIGFWKLQCHKSVYGSASLAGDDRIVFNIMGNKFRLMIRIVFEYKAMQIKWFGTHKEYDKINVSTIQHKTT